MSSFQQLVCTVVAVIGLSTVSAQAASPAAVQFSADTYQTGPKQVQRVGRIFVGKNRIRSEMQQSGQTVVNIIDSDNQLTWVLYPQQRSYIEYSMGDAESGLKGSPCEGIPGSQCKNLGDDKVQGRPATKWEVTVKTQGGEMRSTQWIGKQRSILLRQEIVGGPVMEQRMLAIEELNGRQVEKWEMKMTQANQPTQSSSRWFDPELNLAIKEVNAGGYVRELRNIVVGTQNPALFSIPSNFKKIVPQQKKPTR
ncbi:MAG: DUF4412 domain-containing protein [Sedimenticola sp.]|nr:DUF4412 domain-containing protein [Sedimenticola sp.]